MSRLFRLLALLLLGAGGAAHAQSLLNVCALPDDPEPPGRISRTSVGNYRVYAANSAGTLRFSLDGTSFDLQGLARIADLGTVLSAGQRSQIVGLFYTFEHVGPNTGNNDPTYPVWYFVAPTNGDLSNGGLHTLPLYKLNYAGQFGSGGGSRVVNNAGTLQLQAVVGGDNTRVNALVTMGARSARYCLELDGGTSNLGDAPGSALQGVWSATAGNAFPEGSVSITRRQGLRANFTFFDQRSSANGEPVWGFSDISASATTFPLNVTGQIKLIHNGEVWDCKNPAQCQNSGTQTGIGSASPLRLGTSSSGGTPATLNHGRLRPAIAQQSAPYGGATLSWNSAAEQPLFLSDCVVRMDATPAGLTPGSGTDQGGCPESTPFEAQFYECPTAAGQTSCNVTLRWRIADAYINSRVVAIDTAVPGSIAATVAQSVLTSTGTTFAIPAGKTYRFDVLSGSGNAPVIGRSQAIKAVGTSTMSANGCTIPAGSTSCTASVNWSTTASSTGYVFRVAMPSGTPVSVTSGTSGTYSEPLSQGNYYYELYSTPTPIAANRLASSLIITINAAASSSITAAPASCTIVAPATTCTATANWSTNQTSTAYIFVVGTSPVVAGQLVTSGGSSGSVPRALAAGRYKFELRSTNAASGANLLASSNEVNVTIGSQGEPATPIAPTMPSVPAVDVESSKVGFTGGTFRVDEAGNATYNVPIEAAPGRGGLQPQFALSYSSGSGDGIAGWGTTLEGMGSITRCRYTVEAGDGANKPIGLFSDSYSFCLNGQRLILTNPFTHTEGQEGAEYRTEIDTYQWIMVDKDEVFMPNGSGTPARQPRSFTVYTKDGLVLSFGSDTARRVATLPGQLGVTSGFVEDWWLSSIADRNGNAITFNYSGNASNGSLRLDSATYVGGRIDFNYAARTPAVLYGSMGAKLQQDSLLTSITSRNGSGAELRTLALSHEALPSNAALRRLTGITSCSGGTCQAPTVFNWHDLAGGSQNTEANNGSLPNGGGNFQDIRAYKYGDINGDGRADLVWADKAKGLRLTYSVPTADGLNFSSSTLITGIECERDGVQTTDACSSEGYNRTWTLLDYNGDGREDLLVYQNDAWRLWRGSSTGLIQDTSFALADPAPNLPGTPRVMLADFDGDGLADLLINRKGITSEAHAWMMKRATSGSDPYRFEGPKYVVRVDADGTVIPSAMCSVGDLIGTNGDRSEALDFNGDGLADLALRVPVDNCSTATGQRDKPNWPALQQADPGSAIVDTMASGGSAVFFTSRGVNAANQLTFQLRASLLGLDAANENALRFGDINGDGVPDALVRRPGNTSPGQNGWDEIWTYFYGTPYGWEGPAGGHCVRSSSPGNCLPVGREGQVSLLDHDGDGRLDVFSRRYAGGSSGNLAYDVMLWTGDGFAAPTPTFFHGGDSSWMRGFADIDGDGYYDNVIMRANDDQAAWKAKRSNGHHKPRNMLKSIGHGLGATTQIDYAPTTFSTVYQRSYIAPSLVWGRGSAVQDSVGPRYVVSRVRTSAPTEANAANMAEMQYRYGGFRLQGGGRGGLGFDRVVSVDVTSGISTMTEYNQVFPRTGLTKTTRSWGQGPLADVCAAPDSGDCMTYLGWPAPSFEPLYTAAGDTWRWEIDGISGSNPSLIGVKKPIRLLRNNSSVNKRDDGGFLSASVTTFTSYDAYGNLTQSTSVDYADANLSTEVRRVVTANSYDNDSASWILGRLRSSSVTTSRPGVASLVRNSSFDYNAVSGQLEVERLQPNSGLADALTKVHVYDGYGNEIRTVVCSKSVSETQCRDSSAATTTFRPSDPLHIQRMSAVDMDANAIFVERNYGLYQNLSGAAVQVQTSLVESRDVRGNPTSSLDINNVRSNAGYDGFGRKYFEGAATGAWSQVQWRWCQAATATNALERANCPAGAVYRMRTAVAGGATQWTYFDSLDREVLRVSAGLAATDFNAVRTTYDDLGRIDSVSEPYFTFTPDGASVGQASGGAIYRTVNHYDVFGRAERVVHPNNVGGVTSETRTILAGRQLTTLLPLNANGVNESTVREVNALGELVRVTDHLGSVLGYEYDALGKIVRATRQTHDGRFVQSTASYDALGRKTTMTDPDTGKRDFAYNALGETVQATAPGSCERSSYDGRGRVYSRVNYASESCGGVQDASTTWHFDTAVNGKGQLNSVIHSDETTTYSRTHTYDGFGRLRDTTTTLAGSDYVQSATYDEVGRPFQAFFSGTNLPRSGELQQYNARGYRTTLRNAFPGSTGQAYLELLQADAAGRTLRERRYGNDNLVTQRAYDPATGRTTSIATGGGSLQSLSYFYDPLGNMSWREDRSGGGYLREEFGYDNLQRLTSTYARQANGSGAYVQSAGYDGLGNIAGQITGTKPSYCNAAEEVLPGAGAVSVLGSNHFCYDGRGNMVRTMDPNNANGLEKRRIRYASYDRVREVRNSNPFTQHTSQYQYGPERQMILRRDYSAATPTGTPELTYYAAAAEIIVKPGSTRREVRRTVAGIVTTQVVESNGTLVSVNVDVLLTDVLGSTHRIADTAGVVRPNNGTQMFQAFGARGSATTGQILDGSSRFGFDDSRTRAGFTGQQQADSTGVIHMGARLYDPVLGRFLQADSMVPDPGDLQSLNRYSYVSNNPLAYTDPTGHWGKQQQGYLRTVAAIAIAVWTGAGVSAALKAGSASAAAGGAASGTWMGMTVTASNAGMYLMAGGFAAGAVQTGTLRGAVTGAFSAGLSYGIGNAFPGTANTAGRVLAHSAAGGVLEAMNGGKFGHGFISAGISVGFEPLVNTGNAGFKGLLHVIIGGTAAELSGGKFANGAVTAAFAFAFNDLMHSDAEPQDGELSDEEYFALTNMRQHAESVLSTPAGADGVVELSYGQLGVILNYETANIDARSRMLGGYQNLGVVEFGREVYYSGDSLFFGKYGGTPFRITGGPPVFYKPFVGGDLNYIKQGLLFGARGSSSFVLGTAVSNWNTYGGGSFMHTPERVLLANFGLDYWNSRP